MKHSLFSRGLAMLLCVVLLMGYLPAVSADEVSTEVSTDTAVTETVDPALTEEITVTEVVTVPVTIPEVFEDVIEYTVSTDGEVSITDYFGSAKDVVIPDTVNGMPVVAIGETCFAGNEKLESVVIPDSISYIGVWAFNLCEALQQVTFGTGLKTLDFGAFGGCDLQEVVLPEGLEYIGDRAFHGNYYMTKINIPSTVTYIGEEAFAHCWELAEISTIPASVTYIGTGAFLNCYKLPAIWVDENNINYSSDSQGVLYDKNQTYLYRIPAGYQGDYVMPDTVTEMASYAGYRVDSTGKLTISDNLTVIPGSAFTSSAFTELDLGTGVQTIGARSFLFCSLLDDFEFPASVTKIEEYAFEGCDDLRSMTIPETVKTFGVGIFYGCEDLNYVYLPDSMYSIPEKMFYNCEYLIAVELPETLTSIGTQAFYKCERLKEVILPASLFLIDEDAFTFCYNLKTIVFQGNAPEITDGCMEQVKATAYYPAENTTWTESMFQNYGGYSEIIWTPYATGETPWDPDSLIPEGLSWTVVSDHVNITGYTGTETDLVIPAQIEGEPVEYINANAFYENDTLVSVSLPDSLTEIGNYAFAYCANLQSVEVAEGPTYIGKYAFKSCPSLETVILPQSLLGIDTGAFSNCDSLATFVFPDSVDIVAESVLSGCDHLTSVSLALSTRIIKDGAFYSCPELNSIVLPGAVEEISSDAFMECTGLESITVYDSNPNFGSVDGVLLNKDGTELIRYPAGKTGAYTVPSTVTVIGASAFEMSKVTEIVLPNALTTVAEYAFMDCELLTTVTIPESTSSVDIMAFYRDPALTAIWVHEDNPNYSSDENGVLFNKDKTELIKYPLGRAGEYTVPESVTLIPDYSFFSCHAQLRVTVPNTVGEISMDAFTDCPNLTIRCHIGSVAETYAKEMDIPYEYISGVTSLSIAALPAKLTYAIDSKLRTSGLSLSAVLEDGSTVTVSEGFTVDSVDMSTAGEKTVTVRWSGQSVSYTVTVDASMVDYPESDHPYGENTNETWSYVHNTVAEELQITFSQDTYTEENYDIIYIMDGNGELIGEYTGNALAGKTVAVPGNSFYIQLVSDESVCYNGFTITGIQAVGAPVEETTQPEPSNPSVEIPEYLNYSIVDEKVTITGYTGTADELTIPAYIEGYPVRYVATDAFRANKTLTGIVLPDTLLEIGGFAFCFCENLTYVEIPSGVTIGDWAFAWCNALELITLPEELTSIGESAFYDCSSLTEIVIPDGVTAIPDGLFEECVSLVSVTLPQDCESIGAAAFTGCTSLETLTIPANVLTISMESQEMVFERCSSLKAIYVHDANTNYSSDASGVLFNKEKTDLLQCPAGKTGTYTLPETVTTIREKAFEGSSLTQIILPEALQDIGAYAFAYSSITTITIPQNVVTLGWDRFEGCTDLASIWVHEDNENYSSDSCGVLFNKNKTTLIRMPSAYEGPYSAPEGLLYVGSSAFAQCDGPTEVVLPEGLLGIGGYAFYGSPSLTYVTLPASITDIGDETESTFVFTDSPNLIARCILSTYSANWVASEGVPYEYVDGIASVSIVTLPTKLTYPVGGKLQLDGLVLNAVTDDGLSTIEVTKGFTADPVDMDTAGEKTVRVWWSNCSATFTITVDASLVIYMESAHPYAANTDESWGYVHDIDAEALNITFSEDTETEQGWDFIYIFDAQAEQIGKYSGTELAGQTVTVPGNSFSIRLTSDDGICYYGFAITKVEAVGAETEPTEPETEPTVPDVGGSETEPVISEPVVSEPVESEPVESEPAQVSPEGLTYEVAEGVVTITGYTGSATELTIPSTIEGYPVTGVSASAFSNCSSLISVTIPDTVTYIGDSAFAGCSSLTTITIPDSVSGIGADAFTNCENLTICCSMDSFAATYASLYDIAVEFTDVAVSLEIATLPDQLVYPVGGLIDLTGLTLNVVWENGSTETISSGYSVSECDTSTAGVKTITLSFGGQSVSFEITVDATIPVYPESDHPYTNNLDQTWTYVHNEEADELRVTFSELTQTESNYDWIYILDGDGNQIGDKYSGTTLAGQTVTILGNSFSVRLTSDYSNCEYFGFAVTNVEAIVYCTHSNCQWTVIQQPTFTVVGQQQAVCPDCGETVTQEIPCLEGKVDQWNISLQDDLQVNFHLAISESIEDVARVKILVGNDAVTYRASALSKTEDGLYIVSANIAAAQMTDDIIVMVVASGNVSTSTYTVRQYADTVLADESLSDYHAMVKEMLNYGAAAQAYFDYDADMAANEGITDVGVTEVPETAEQDLSVTGNTASVSFYAASLLYRDKVTLRFYFKVTGDVSSYSFTANGVACKVVQKGSYYVVDVAGITPENLDQQVTITVTDTDGNALVVSYSPMNYMVRMNAKGSDELKALLKALYNYHLAAKALRVA